MSETYMGSSNHLTQGQQQTYKSVNAIDVNPDVKLSVYPNPTQDFLTIVSSDTNMQLSLQDSKGALVKNGSIEDSQTTFEMSGIESGVYYLNVYDQTGSLIKVFKVVKQ